LDFSITLSNTYQSLSAAPKYFNLTLIGVKKELVVAFKLYEIIKYKYKKFQNTAVLLKTIFKSTF